MSESNDSRVTVLVSVPPPLEEALSNLPRGEIAQIFLNNGQSHAQNIAAWLKGQG
jgi:hypothetical protein